MEQHKPKLRERKERKLYSDDWALGDEEIEGYHTFDLDEKITTDRFTGGFVKHMADVEFELSYFQKNGFNWPMLFKTKEKLGMVVPGEDFTINDVRLGVGSRRMLDVMDVNTQKNVEMTMKDWQRYFESKDKDKLLNVISLEFSHTKLEHLVQAPAVVRQIDWVEKVWPRHLKEAQTEATNVLEDMMYPKVQKYCLMSVGGCYTDFHIDFGGTSVWYHILKGKKIFWLIPPTEGNLLLYEQWVLSGKQGDVFFADTVDKCERIQLITGNTFFIPTGWIHAVYTPDDSLVFGGNFLHSYGIEKQLRVAQVEDTTHVPQKFRYPFFTEMLWYVLERYVHVLLGRTHLSLPPSEHEKLLLAVKKENRIDNNNMSLAGDPSCGEGEAKHTHLTRYELHGLKAIVMYLHSLPYSRKNVPDLVADPVALIQDVKTLVEVHRFDRPEMAMTSKPVLEWWEREPVRFGHKRSSSECPGVVKRPRGESAAAPRLLPPNLTKVRYRRTRCRDCDACQRADCRQCSFCLDMTRYGGSGILKQRCKLKKCPKPTLPERALCYVCSLDGHMQGVYDKRPKDGSPSNLMECSICYKVCHPDCLEMPGIAGVIHEDYPNSWDCPECINEGYDKDFKHSRSSGRLSAVSSDSNAGTAATTTSKLEPGSLADDTIREVPAHQDNQEHDQLPASQYRHQDSPTPTRQTPPHPSSSSLPGHVAAGAQGVSSASSQAGAAGLLTDLVAKPVAVGATTVKQQEDGQALPPPMPTWNQLQARVSKALVAPLWVVRPAPIEVSRFDAGLDDGDEVTVSPKPAIMCGIVLRSVFRYLSVNDLLSAMRTCRDWARWSVHPTLWPHISLLPNKTVEPIQLEGIVRRQPRKLTLNWVTISQEQLKWLLMRLPQLSELDCEGLSWGEVRCLATCFSPPLVKLNLNFVEGINDGAIKLLLSSPISRRPGFRNHQSSRLSNLTHLSLAGAWISDGSIRALCTELQLMHLDISNCPAVSEDTIQIIAETQSKTIESLDVHSCSSLGPLCLPDLAKFKLLSRLAISQCPLIPAGAIRAWSQTHGYSEGKDRALTRVPPSVRQVNMAIQSRLVKTAFAKILEKLTQKVDFGNVLPGNAGNDTLVNGVGKVAEQKRLDDSKPSTSGSSLISSGFKKSEDSGKGPADSSNILKESSSGVVERGSLLPKKILSSVKTLKALSEKDEISDTEEKEDELSSPSKVKLNKSPSDTSHSEKSPTRSRRRPSRFSDPDVEFSSPAKNPRKKMKQVTVALEDIGASTKFTAKRPLESSKKRDLVKPIDAPKRKAFIGPKSRCPPRLEEPVTEAKTYDASESDVSLASVDAPDDSLESPRRTQRRSRDTSLEELKEKPVPKDLTTVPGSKKPKASEDDETIPDCVPKVSPIKKKGEEDKPSKKRDGYPGDNPLKKGHKKEKDIMTRSKRLKQDPSKALHSGLGSISPELKSPRVMVCRKEVESVPGKARSKGERIKAVTKRKCLPESDGKLPKRPRSASSSDMSPSPSPSKKFPSELKERGPVYSSKLRKKWSEGVVTPDPLCREDFEPENVKKDIQESPRSRRRSHREEEDKSASDDRQSKNTVESSPARESELLSSPAQRPCRRKTDDCESPSKDTKVEDCRVETKKKKAMVFKLDTKKMAGSSSVSDRNDSSAREVESCASDTNINKTIGEKERDDVSESLKSSKLQSTATPSKSLRREKSELTAANDSNNSSTSHKSSSSSTAVEEAKPTLFTQISKKCSVEKLSIKRKDSDNVKDIKFKATVRKKKESDGDVFSHKIKVCKTTPKYLEEKCPVRPSHSEVIGLDPVPIKRDTTEITIDQKKNGGTGALASGMDTTKKSVSSDKLTLNMKIKNKDEKSANIKMKGELLDENKHMLAETNKNVKKIIPGQKEGTVPPSMTLEQLGSNLEENVEVEPELRSKENVPGSSKLSIESTLGINRERPGIKMNQEKEEFKITGDTKASEHCNESLQTADNNKPLSRDKDVVPIVIEKASKGSTKKGNVSVSGSSGALKESDRYIKECEPTKELPKHFPHQPRGVSCKSDEVTKTQKWDSKTSTSAETDVSAAKQEDFKRLSKSSSENKLSKKKNAAALSAKDCSSRQSSNIRTPITTPKTDLQKEKSVTSTLEVAKSVDQNKGANTTTADNAEKNKENTSRSTIKHASLPSGNDIKEVTKSAKTSERVSATQPDRARTSTANVTQPSSDKKIEQSSSISNAGKSSTVNKNLERKKEFTSNFRATTAASDENNGEPRAAVIAPARKDDSADNSKAVDVSLNRNISSVAVKISDSSDVDLSAKNGKSDVKREVKDQESVAPSIVSSIPKAEGTIKPKETPSIGEIESTTKTTASGECGPSSQSKLTSNDSNILDIKSRTSSLVTKPMSFFHEKMKLDSASKVKQLSKADVNPSGGTPVGQGGSSNSSNEDRKSVGDCNKSDEIETVRSTSN